MTHVELLEKIFIGYKKTYTDPREFWDVLKELANGTGNASLVVVDSIANLQAYGAASDENVNTLILGTMDSDGGIFYYSTDALVPDGVNIISATGRGSGYWVRAVLSGSGNLYTENPVTEPGFQFIQDQDDNYTGLGLAQVGLAAYGPIVTGEPGGGVFDPTFTTAALFAMGMLTDVQGSGAVGIGSIVKSQGQSSVAIGTGTQALENHDVAFGQNAIASGQNSVAFQGANAEAIYSFSHGNSALGRWAGAFTYGYAQNNNDRITNKPYVGRTLLNYLTNDATPVDLSDGSTAQSPFVLRDNSFWEFVVEVSAIEVGTLTTAARWSFKGVISRGAGVATVAIVGVPIKTVHFNGLATADIEVIADTTRGSLAVRATGEAATSIRWIGEIVLAECLIA
ncbi:MAG: hypothetical protein HWD92_08835 [Flavobacteriia bacterium]|nr:hypothetical protein [Flavobacteriia bacterium]